MAKKKNLQQSETRIIKRSQIRKNPSNVKRHSDDRVKLQAKNLRKVGYLGGIVWNETSGNLVDGHRRIQAMDLYYGYDGTPETDYDVKVEVVHMDEKEEKQQLAYMGAGDTKADIDLIANLADDINLEDIGLSDAEIDEIMSIAGGGEEDTPDYLEELMTPREAPKKGTEEYEKAKAMVKDGKSRNKDNVWEYAMDDAAHIVISFSTYENFMSFCALMQILPSDKFVKGEELLKMFE